MTKAERLLTVLALASALLAPAEVWGQGRELSKQHDGSLGLFGALGAEYTGLVIADCFFCTGSTAGSPARAVDGFDAILDLGGSLAVGQSNSELLLRGRLVFLSPARGVTVLFGYRKYWGMDELKTYVAADVLVTLVPTVVFGVRPNFGVMWDFSPIMGVWAEAGGTFAVGWGRRFGGEITVGFQARSYLLE